MNFFWFNFGLSAGVVFFTMCWWDPAFFEAMHPEGSASGFSWRHTENISFLCKWLFTVPLIAYVLWQVLYFLIVNVLRRQRLLKDPEVMTSYRLSQLSTWNGFRILNIPMCVCVCVYKDNKKPSNFFFLVSDTMNGVDIQGTIKKGTKSKQYMVAFKRVYGRWRSEPFVYVHSVPSHFHSSDNGTHSPNILVIRVAPCFSNT